MNLAKHLDVFASLIATVQGDNVAIGGWHSLALHGLNMSRQTKDLDIVIFSPTKEQIAALESVKFFKVVRKDDNPDHNYPIAQCDSVQFCKGGLTVDFLLEPNKPTPEDLLTYTYNGVSYKVQSVQGTIDAKNSFTRKGDDGVPVPRLKDVLDFLDLKQSNFNLKLPG